MGATRRRPHLRLRRSGRLTGRALLEERGAQLARIAWRTVGTIVTRVAVDAGPATTTSPGYAIDEMSDKQGHRYLTVVVDQDRRRLVWAALGVAEGKSAVDLQGLAAGVAAVGLDESVVDALGLEPGERKCRS